MRKIPLNFPLYDSMYGSSIPEEQYYIILFDCIGSSHSSQELYSDEVIKYFIENLGFEEDMRVNSFREHGKVQNRQSLLVNKDKRMIISTRLRTSKGDGLISFDILYDMGQGEIEEQLNYIDIKKFKKESKKSGISTTTSMRKRSRAADGISNVSSRSTRLRSANT